MLLLIDNYDSFTYNLLHYFSELGADVEVVRNDAISVSDIAKRKDIDGLVLSPGPCSPNEAGICLDVVKEMAGVLPIFGVCLGHQTIGQVFGGKVVRAPEPIHGKVSRVMHEGQGVFKDIPSPFEATRYHSLLVEEASLPECLAVTARTEDGLIMGVQHRTMPIHGVQFHPESIASQHGHKILKNFLEVC